MRRGLLAAALALLAAAVVPACRRSTPGTIRIAHESDALSLDPAAISEAATHSILSNIFDGLVVFDRDMALTPSLAVTWGNVDRHTWVIELRKGVVFHDGTPLTAELVRRVLLQLKEGPGPIMRSRLSTIGRVESDGELNLRIVTSRPDPLLMNRLADVLIGWVAREKDGTARPVGSGPYRFVRWEKGRALELERNPRYWGTAPAFERAVFVPVEEGKKSIDLLRQGAVDVLRFVPEPLASELRGARRVRVASRIGLGTYYLWLNTEEAKGGPKNPMADVRVRRAISMAIDRHAILASLGGYGVPANQLVQPGVFGYIARLPELPYDPAGARALLAQAGYPDGFETTLVHRAGASMDGVAAAVRRALAEIGVRVTTETLDWQALLSRWQAGRLPFLLSGWTFDSGDALSFFVECLATRDPARQTGLFNPGYSNPRLDRMIEEQGERFEDAMRLGHYESLMRVALDDMPLVPLFTRTYLFGVSTNVRWKPRLDGRLLAAEMAPAR